MANLSQKILAELENLDEVIDEMPAFSDLPNLSNLELARVAALPHNFYIGEAFVYDY